MIIEYHRPENMDQALALLARPEPRTIPLGGGSVVSQPSDDEVAVVDVQALGLNKIKASGKTLEVGAAVTLQALLDNSEIFPALRNAIRHEATYNLRQTATVAGTLVAADGRSPFGTAMLSLGPDLILLPGHEKIALGEVLPLRGETLEKKLISQINLPTNVKLSYEYVARTPADLPIVCVAVAQWPSGRTRVALGGYGAAPLLAMDGPQPQGADVAARDAFREAGDQWATAAYRSDVAAKLVKRILSTLVSGD